MTIYSPRKTCVYADIKLATSDKVVNCIGDWTLKGVGNLEQRLTFFDWPDGSELIIDLNAIDSIDTAGAWFLQRAIHKLEEGGRVVKLQGQRPEQIALFKMIQLASTETSLQALPSKLNFLGKIGLSTWMHFQQVMGMLAFFGESAIAIFRSIAQPSRIRWSPILYNLQHAGFNALPIVGLLGFLMGIVIAYQGAEQLQRYGANIFIADLVGLSMLRELSPLLTAIIVAGRSGSAFTAQIGTMKVTEEIDALRTIGIAPMELLVLPKLLALVIALPLLTVYSDMMGVIGGMIMAKSQLGVGYAEFIDRFDDAVKLSSFMVGVGKAPVFAVIIAMVGCFQGFQVSNGADSVGRQTTVSVVQAIFVIIVADALFSVVFSWLKI
ncbi:ABC transporter permease [Sulfurirhabdus autotrophica]|uniref:Phospholipid/cholesterol/gamma-HCH transport system permease protein n=1 Tax=Sulfurirhabdus autotrophica TaxID=1706046 RepID=A0A4R3YHI8_9PROT|nr:MlaE family lipid ABC transporter permease subunit [Sulfurirhabdus autotrophica]TCV90454.1 phospholipid/cholesterol/gamma-HCH transport system permease protein [Sulfurirhabdus autotrophica]